MNLIFLDVDGVLNTHQPLEERVMCGKLHASKVRRLNLLIQETDARIVLSSAWRYLVHRGEMNLTGLGWLLRSHGAIDCLVGITRPDTMERPKWDGSTPWQPCNNERGQQIREWIDNNEEHWRLETPHRQPERVERYVVIDDLDLGISEAKHPFVHVNGQRGFTWADYDKALEILKG